MARGTALELVFVTQSLKKVLGGDRFVVRTEVFQHPLVDDVSDPIQLASFDLRQVPIAKH
ncbi:MAG: hypothetical protein WBM80_14275 [Woeseiaceae bacterium]